MQGRLCITQQIMVKLVMIELCRREDPIPSLLEMKDSLANIRFLSSAGFVKFFLGGPFPSLLFPLPSLSFPLPPPFPSLLYPSPIPLPLPPFPSLFSLLPSLPLPSPPLEVAPLFAARGCGGALISSPTGFGRSPAAKRFLVHFSRKIWHLVATIKWFSWEINWPNFVQFTQ